MSKLKVAVLFQREDADLKVCTKQAGEVVSKLTAIQELGIVPQAMLISKFISIGIGATKQEALHV